MLSVSLLHNNYKGNGTRAVNYNNYPWFQSTFPQGERPSFSRPCGIDNFISIHVPTRGTTFIWLYNLRISWFQSTFPQGERHRVLRMRRSAFSISIHVPTRGTTLRPCRYHPRIGGFQSTFPQGERPRTRLTVFFFSFDFNPRSHKGNDIILLT